MADLTEKVEALEKRLDKLSDVFDHIQRSLGTKDPNRRNSVSNQSSGIPPKWVKEIIQHFNEISTELRSVKKTLDARSVLDNHSSRGHTPASNAEAPPEAELEHISPSQRQHAEPILPESSGDRQQASVTADIPEPGGQPSPLSLPDPSVIIGEHMPQDHPVPISDEDSRTVSISTKADNASFSPSSDKGFAPIFSCNYKDISGNLNEAKLKQFSANPRVKKRGYFKLVVEGLPPLNVEEGSFKKPGKYHSTTFSYEPDSRGYVKVTKRQNQKENIKFPVFPLPTSQRQSWSQSSLRDMWETTLTNPPPDMHYIIGDPLFPDMELSSGEGLKRIGGNKLPGIGTTYIYLCCGISLTIMHEEDAKFRSLNLLRGGGDKLWLIVQPAYAEELVSQMRKDFPQMTRCSQAMRHISRVISPSKLDEWHIPYSLDYTKPGQAIVTEEGAYHQIINMSSNYAIATNVSYGSSPIIPEGYIFCEDSCDPDSIRAIHLQPCEKGGPPVETQVTKRVRLPRSTIAPTLASIVPSKRKAIPDIIQSETPMPTPDIDSLVEAVCGRDAFYHLCSLIRSWRDRSTSLFEIDKSRPSAIQLVGVISLLEERSLLTEFLNRLARFKLAEIIDTEKQGRLQADAGAITNLLRDLEWTDSKKNRNKLNYYLQEGRRWKRMCGKFDGLLCLVPPNREDKGNSRRPSGRTYQGMSNDNIQQFHSQLESNKLIGLMCQVGNTFHTSIWDNIVLPKFLWENEDPEKVAGMPLNKLALIIKQF